MEQTGQDDVRERDQAYREKLALEASIARQIAYEPSWLPSARAIAERFNVSADIAREARL